MKKSYVGAYSKLTYAPAGSEVYIIGRQDNMILVIWKDFKFWTFENYLTTNPKEIQYESASHPKIPAKPKKSDKRNRR